MEPNLYKKGFFPSEGLTPQFSPSSVVSLTFSVSFCLMASIFLTEGTCQFQIGPPLFSSFGQVLSFFELTVPSLLLIMFQNILGGQVRPRRIPP